MALSEADRLSMLAEPAVATLSIASTTCRGPICIPVWYLYYPSSNQAVFMSEVSARKVSLLKKSGRGTLLVQRTEPTYRYVTIEGPVSFGPASTELLNEIALRYLPPDKAKTYAEGSPVGTYTTVTLTPERWTGADLGEF